MVEEENGFILSNDGSVYVEPEPMPEPEPEPEPEPYEPTLEDLQEAKVAEMNMAQQGIIAAGVDVVLTDGTTEHFTLEDHDQTSLVGLQSQVAAGEENIPWHTSNEAEHCKFYSNKDMKKITATAMAYVTWHVTYFRDLRIYIRSLESNGSCNIYNHLIDTVIAPQEKGEYRLIITYKIADEVLIESVKVWVM